MVKEKFVAEALAGICELEHGFILGVASRAGENRLRKWRHNAAMTIRNPLGWFESKIGRRIRSMQMEEAKELVQVASTFLAEQEPAAKAIRLEQIEEHNDGEWSIVLSFPDLSVPVAALFGNGASARVYKELLVDGDKKEVRALRIWK